MGRLRARSVFMALSSAALWVGGIHPVLAAGGFTPSLHPRPAVPSGPVTPGAELWVKRYNGPDNGDDKAIALGVSPDGSEVFVTGYVTRSSNHSEYATVAYAAATGKRLWKRRYNGPGEGNDEAAALGVSPDGSTVFVTGYSAGSTSGPDYATLAYDASTGAQLWVARYNGPGNYNDAATGLGVSPDGSTVFVTGYSWGATGFFDYATVAYDASTGAQLWVARYNGPGNDFDLAAALSVSPDGSTVFVTGYSSPRGFPDYATLAYRASTGEQLWVARYDGPGSGDDEAHALGVSPDGSIVFVTGGSSVGNSEDYATVAYNASTGAQLWVERYNGPGNSIDLALALGVSQDGASVFVTGYSRGSRSFDYATVAYSATTGAVRWVKRYNGPAGGDDVAVALTVSPDGSDVFVTGQSVGPGISSDYATVAYDASTGHKLWAARYHGPQNLGNFATALGVSPDGSMVFVTGASDGGPSSFDFATIAYSTS